MEQLKIKNDETITLRFLRKFEAKIRGERDLKKNFKTQNLTSAEIQEINKIICLGNKITKGHEDKENNSNSKYDTNAKMYLNLGQNIKLAKQILKDLEKYFSLEVISWI